MNEIKGVNEEMLEPSQLQDEIKQLSQEIEFAANILDIKVNGSGKRSDQSLKDFENKLSTLDGFLG